MGEIIQFRPRRPDQTEIGVSVPDPKSDLGSLFFIPSLAAIMDENLITLNGVSINKVKQQIETMGDLDGNPAAIALVNVESWLFSVQLQYVNDNAPSRRVRRMSVALARHFYGVGLALDSERLRDDAAAVLIRIVGPSKAATIIENVSLEEKIKNQQT